MSLYDAWSGPRRQLHDLGLAMRADRDERGMSQASYALLISAASGTTVDHTAVSRMERGQLVPDYSVGSALSMLLRLEEKALQAPTPARLTDPATSHENGPSANTAVHAGIRMILNRNGKQPHFELVRIYTDWMEMDAAMFPPATPQRIRTATHELVQAGFVENSGTRRKNERGRSCIEWQLIQNT